MKSTRSIILSILSIILQPSSVLSKGGGGGSSGSGSSSGGGSGSSSGSGGRGGGYYGSGNNSRWVFWYYGPYGNRTCGNLCIVTFTLLALIVVTIIGCLLYHCIWSRKRKKRENFQSNSETSPPTDGYYSSPSTNPYPQRTDLESGSVPPTYENEPPATEPIAWHGQKHEAPAAAFEAGEKFTRDYPPQEKLPSDSDISYIINKGGAPAYRFELGPQVGTRQQPSVLNDGRLIQFHGKEDTMVQTNHPLFVPSLTADAISTTRDESSESSESKDVNYEKDKKNVKDDKTIIRMSMPMPMPTPMPTSKPTTPKESSEFLSYASSATDQKRSSRTSLSAVVGNTEILHYFEITVLSNTSPKDVTIAIGLATKPYPSFRLPGWNLYSVGYHSDDGRKFNDAYGGRKYGPEWGKVGDTVGCGYYPATGYVFFTKNGRNLGTAFTGIRHLWYPTVGADGPCKLEVNFGDGTRPFRYNEARGFGPTGPVRKIKN